MGFVAEQLERLRPTWEHMLRHPFLLETRDGTIPFETFANWLREDYLFVEAAVPFIALMIPKAPPSHWELYTQVIAMFHKELGLFRERAKAVGVDMSDLRPSFTNHAFIQFLIATASQRSYAEIYTVLYAAEKAYHDSWTVVKKGIDPASPWYPFVENWAGEAFAEYVTYLEKELDALAAAAGPAERERMAELFELTLRYEIAFWEMAANGDGWPEHAPAELAAAKS
jgi:thiaminase/transcriptional activator TenA